MNKNDLVNLDNIYFSTLVEVKDNRINNKETFSCTTDKSTILLERTFKERTIENITYEEYTNVITDEMILVDYTNNIFYPKKGEFKYLENTLSVSNILNMTSKKANSRYTDYIYSKITTNIYDNIISREVLFDNIDNIKYLGDYALNLQKDKIRVR